MKWAFIAIGAVVAIIALIVVVGALLPHDHVATLAAHIAAPPSAVWATITNPTGFTTWRPDVTRIELVGTTPNGPSWREHSRHGAITMVIDVAVPPTHLVTRIADENLPYGGRWEFDIAPDGATASRVVISEHGSVYNPVFRFVSRFVLGHTQSIDTYLRALGKHFGSEPTPIVVATIGGSHGI